jgi:hypothetical protein
MADVRDVRTEPRRQGFDTDPRNRSAAEIEREVDAERARVAETIDKLQNSVSLGNVVDEVVRTVGPYGADFGRNLSRQVRDNPLPLLLTGLGLAWLMVGSGPRREDRYWEDYDQDDLDEVYRPAAASATPVYPEASWESDRDEEASGMSMGERMRRARAGVGHAASGAASGVGSAASGIASGVGHTASGVADAAGRATGAVRGAGSAAWHSAGSVGRSAYRGGRSLQDGFERMLDEQPLVVGALAFAAGAAIGSTMPRSRTEDDLFGAQSDRVMARVRDTAAEQGHRLQETAEKVAGKVADEAARVIEEETGKAERAMSQGEPGQQPTRPDGQPADEPDVAELGRRDAGQPKPPVL